MATWRDHYDFRDEDVAWLARAARKADHVVVTGQGRGQAAGPVAGQRAGAAGSDIECPFEAGGDAFVAALDALVSPVKRP